MKARRMPDPKYVKELAEFWDTHDLSDFESQLEEVKAPVFERKSTAELAVSLKPREAEAIRRIAHAKGVQVKPLLRKWILERMQNENSHKKTKV